MSVVTRRRGTVAGLFVVYLIAVVGNGAEVVLCMADSGRVALEFDHDQCCETTPTEPSGDAEQPDGCCVAIPVSLPGAAPHTSPSPPRVSLTHLAPAELDPAAPAVVEPTAADALLALPSLPPPLAVLRTVVLLL
jgi:hypothetical protein